MINPERCDDGTPDGLGCNTFCNGTHPAFSCSGGNLSTPTLCSPICGDGKVYSPEICDDGS